MLPVCPYVERLTAERRKELAWKAVKARWDKVRAIKKKENDPKKSP